MCSFSHRPKPGATAATYLQPWRRTVSLRRLVETESRVSWPRRGRRGRRCRGGGGGGGTTWPRVKLPPSSRAELQPAVRVISLAESIRHWVLHAPSHLARQTSWLLAGSTATPHPRGAAFTHRETHSDTQHTDSPVYTLM